MLAKYLTAAVLIAGLAIPVVAAQPIGEASSADARLALYRAVSDAVHRYASYSIFDTVHAELDGGTITLTGRVTQSFKVRGIERRVAQVDGVRGVRNEIKVLPVSQFDDRLRLGLARAIYGNPHFRQYGAVTRPIHIIVERGHVTLEGVVLGETDRALARTIARGFTAFSVVTNLKTPAEARLALESL